MTTSNKGVAPPPSSRQNLCLHGSTYGLTTLSPVCADTIGYSPRAALERALEAMPVGPASPLAQLPSTHFARFLVITRLPFEGKRAWADTLPAPYLLFTSQFDGSLDDYLDAMATRIPGAIDAIWGHCNGYPGTSDPVAFANYIKQCQLETTFFFGAYPSATVAEVHQAISTQDQLRRFVVDNQGKAPADLRRAFAAFRQNLRPSSKD